MTKTPCVPPARQPAERPAVKLHELKTVAYTELIWSYGHKLRLRSFADLYCKRLSPEERLQRRRSKRARKVARRAEGTRLRATLAEHGLSLGSLRRFWYP